AAPAYEIQKMSAVRQELRVAVCRVLRTENSGLGRLSDLGRNAKDRAARSRREQNHAVAVPGSAAALCGRRQREHGTAGDVDLLERAVREEPDEPSVR